MATCLIGEKLNYSLSKKIHNMLGDLSYELLEIPSDGLKQFVANKKYVGFNVTAPYKEEIIKYLDFIDDEAKSIGAVNTVVLKDNNYYGYNTDAYGFKRLLENNSISVLNKRVLILGSGGAAKACEYVVKSNGGSPIIVSRTGKINYSNVSSLDPNIIVNATPVGNINNMYSLVDIKAYKNLEAVIDLSYNPINTKLLQEAIKLNIKAVNGLEMLVYQAIKANSLFYSKNENDISRDIITKLLSSQKNIVLIGMSGVGKTVIGKALSEKMGYNFIDIDEEIEKKYGSISMIFETKGESYFRDLEKDLIKKYSLLNNYVISPGGGSIIDNENQMYLKANATIVLINRDIENVDISNRPLIKNIQQAKLLFEKRKDIYFANADIIVDNDSTIDNVVNKIVEKL